VLRRASHSAESLAETALRLPVRRLRTPVSSATRRTCSGILQAVVVVEAAELLETVVLVGTVLPDATTVDRVAMAELP
jgi:hypothetical protein